MSVRVVVGSALDVLRTLPSESVQLVVTSPPYFALRSYLPDGHHDKQHEIGGEPTPWAFLESLWAVFDEVKRVLRPDGLCFVNIGDSYSGSGKGPSNSLQRPASCLNDRQLVNGAAPRAWVSVPDGIPAKNLMLIPQRFAIGMQDRGWWVRSEIVWAKTSAMPESVKDRPTSAWEPIWMFAKSARYWYDGDAVRQPAQDWGLRDRSQSKHNTEGFLAAGQPPHRGLTNGNCASIGANLRNVWTTALTDMWTLGPEPSKEAHYASFPTAIPRLAISAGTSEKGACPSCGDGWRRVVERKGVRELFAEKALTGGKNADIQKSGQRRHALSFSSSHDTPQSPSVKTLGWEPGCSCSPVQEPRPCVVLDPFLGSGTTLLVASRLGRDGIGIELNEEYARLAEARIARDVGPMFPDEVAVERTDHQPALFADHAAG